MSGGASSIAVTVRVRPFTIREAAQITKLDDGPTFFGDGSLAGTPKPTLTSKGIRRVIKVVDENFLIFDPPEDNPMARFQKTILGPQGKKVKDMKFGFDKVFDENVTQQEVYEATTRGLLDSVLDGFNATVFAYGATGCGKTHTISGTQQHPGIIFLTCAELFERIDSLASEKTIDLTLSYLEIYNETIRDLLIPGGSDKGLALREDSNATISVSGLSTHKPQNVEQVMEMILLGNANRTMSPTEANATSSRSHAVLQINVVQKNRTAGISEDHFAATLSIIDLAGSERASVTKNRGDRLLEGANINRSLLALGNCINALCDPARKSHVPYRDSKLTRLLKFSLGGNCKTVMIVCVSPSSHHYDETHNTLKYANRAKNIKTKVSRNMINVNRHVSQYVKAIFDLTNEVAELKKRLQNSVKEAMDKINKSQAAKDHVMKEGIRSIRAASDKTKDARKNKTKNMGNLRLMDRRMAVISAWCEAFDTISTDRASVPSNLVKIREIASNTLRDLAQQKKWLEDQLTLNHWHADIDKALKGSLQSLANLQDGAKEQDIDILTREANLVKASGERDIMEELLIEAPEVDLVEKLTKAHFNAILALQTLSTMNDEQIATEGSTAVLSIIQLCADATSQVIKPNGELVGTEKTYQPSTPGKWREKEKAQRIATPVKMATPVKATVHVGQPEKSFEGSTPLSIRKRSDKVGTPKKATPRKPRVLVISKTPTNAKKRVRWDSNVHSNKKKDRDNKTECSTTASSHNDSFSLLSHSQTDASLNRSHVVEVHADDELDEPSFLNNTFSSSSAPSRRNSRMAIGFLSKKSEADEETNSSTSSPENWSRAPPLRDVQLDAVINQPKYHHQRNNINSKSSRLSSVSNSTSTTVHFENKAPQLTTISEPYQDTYSSSDSEQFSASRPPTTTINIGGSLGRHSGPRISSAAQNQLKSALKKSITNSNSASSNERPLSSSNHVPSAATSSTAAARARRRSPPRSSLEGGSSKSGNGARRNIRDKENGQSKALSPRSSGALMKANNRRLTITGAPGYSDQLLGHLQKEAEEDQVMPAISAALRDTSMITSGKPVWR